MTDIEFQGAQFEPVLPDGRVALPESFRRTCQWRLEAVCDTDDPRPLFRLRPGGADEPDFTELVSPSIASYNACGWLELSPGLIGREGLVGGHMVFVGQGPYIEIWTEYAWRQAQFPISPDDFAALEAATSALVPGETPAELHRKPCQADISRRDHYGSGRYRETEAGDDREKTQLSPCTTYRHDMSEPPCQPATHYLIERHPTLFRGRIPPCRNEIEPGWVPLIDELLTDMEQIAAEKVGDVTMMQIKVKFGDLRVGISMMRQGETWAEDDLDVRAHPAGTLRALSIQLRERIETARIASRRLCAACGAPGRMLKRDGWYYVACGKHRTAGSVEVHDWWGSAEQVVKKPAIDPECESRAGKVPRRWPSR
ncbi:MAG TPA: hypothetical protein VEN78_22325 [Bradyrhizobium sp.]|nr:hypothetical protein [Bradyrhizobium sp.]